MTADREEVLDELVRASTLLTDDVSVTRLTAVLVEQAHDITRSSVSVLYLRRERRGDFTAAYRRGRLDAPDTLSGASPLVGFLEECGRSVVVLDSPGPFGDVLLSAGSASGVALPLAGPSGTLGVLVCNSSEVRYYGRSRLQFLDGLIAIAAGILNTARLYRELQDHARRIEELQRYQDGVFDSMTDLLVTLDAGGRVHYFNRAAAERLRLDESKLGDTLRTIFGKALARSVLNRVDRVARDRTPVVGLEGIYKTDGLEMDYSLNITPLVGRRGRGEGVTLVFTDQTAEHELRKQIGVATEERRVIKDMFAAYLSEDIMRMLVEQPELVRPGGGMRTATIFFADIAGYTSFSEGRDPAVVVQVLNEFFEEAEPIVRRYRGYLDKYIGDCIMAVFGVPIENGPEDTVNAVGCAVELQELVGSTSRTFFRGEAEHLRIQIGMHTGPVVAGNLGGSRRMDFTEIGDTVNVAARLEGVAGPGEIIITEQTRGHLGDRFMVDPREPVKVKGKAEPIPIYNVIGVRRTA